MGCVETKPAVPSQDDAQQNAAPAESSTRAPAQQAPSAIPLAHQPRFAELELAGPAQNEFDFLRPGGDPLEAEPPLRRSFSVPAFHGGSGINAVAVLTLLNLLNDRHGMLNQTSQPYGENNLIAMNAPANSMIRPLPPCDAVSNASATPTILDGLAMNETMNHDAAMIDAETATASGTKQATARAERIEPPSMDLNANPAEMPRSLIEAAHELLRREGSYDNFDVNIRASAAELYAPENAVIGNDTGLSQTIWKTGFDAIQAHYAEAPTRPSQAVDWNNEWTQVDDRTAQRFGSTSGALLRQTVAVDENGHIVLNRCQFRVTANIFGSFSSPRAPGRGGEPYPTRV